MTNDKLSELTLVSHNLCPYVQRAMIALEEKGAAYNTRHPERFDEVVASVDKDHLATLIYTSGTTGRPKGVELLHDPLTDVPLALRQAIVATEDATFWDNPGLDARAILRAVWLNLSGGKVLSGASTLTQQLAKNLYFSPERSLMIASYLSSSSAIISKAT